MPQNSAFESQPHFSGSDFDEMVDTFRQQFGPFDASLTGSRRDFQWKAEVWSTGAVTLVTGQYFAGWKVRTEPETPEWLSILLPREGAIDMTLGGRNAEGVPGRLLLARNHDVERYFVRGTPHLSDVLRLDWSSITQAVAGAFELPLNGTLELLPSIDLSKADGQLIGNLSQTIVAGMRNNGPLLRSPVAMSNLTSALADLIVRSIPHRLSHLLEGRPVLIAPWHVRDAINFMHANIGLPITIAMVAKAVGISTRALESGFHTFRETTPSAYLRSIRLRAAREDLCDPSNRESVRDICLKWGFFHFGRFSAAYRKAYGENPTDTKRRAAIN